MTPRRISSMSSGEMPVFTMWPPSIATTPRLRRAASAIASATATKVARDEHIGERRDECVERPIVARRMRELFGLDLVRSASDGDGADRGEIRFARQPRGRGVAVSVGGLLAAGAGGVVGGGRYDLR